VNLEAIYVDSEEFSFEELLAKKKGLYGLKFEVEKQLSPIESVFKPLSQKSPETTVPSRSTTTDENLSKVTRSPRLQKISTPSPPRVTKGHIISKEDDIVYIPLRGLSPLVSK